MSKTLLIPKNARIFPTEISREFAANINKKYGPKDFDSYNEWFYFIHIDPAQRLLHAFGMSVGTLIYIYMIYEWSLWSILYYFVGTFFFYVIGIISHILYDKGTAKSERKYLLKTFWPVIRINFLTLTKAYDKDLRKFVEKYPFVVEAHQLIEIEKNKVFKHLRQNK